MKNTSLFLKNKLKIFKVEYKFGHKVKCMWSNNNGEHDKQTFKRLCSKHGI